MSRWLTTERKLMARLDYLAALLFCSLLFTSGCGRGTVQIDALFKLDGQPLADAGVSFVRADEGGGRLAVGATDAEGHLVDLTTYKQGDGILPGRYKVVVAKTPAQPWQTVAPENDETSMSDEEIIATSVMQEARVMRYKHTSLPDIYADPGTTPLECEVARKTSRLAFDLDSNADQGK